MKPQNKAREVDAGKPSKKKREKNKKVWRLQYRWKSKKDYNTYPSWWSSRKEYSPNWTILTGFWERHSSAKAAEDYIKKELRSSFLARFMKGREWRVVNEETGQIIHFQGITEFYDT